MFLNRTSSTILLALAGFSAGCKQAPPSVATQQVAAQAVRPPAPAQPAAPQRETSLSNAPQVGTPQAGQAAQAARVPGQEPKVEDVEKRQGPFTIAGQTFTVVLHSKRLPGQMGDFADALASLDIVDANGGVQHHEEFPHAIENGSFSESCSATVNTISGSNGAGFLLDTGCLPSAPMSGGPWEILGVVNGKLVPVGKPLYAEGEMGDFVPGKINKIGNLTQILADELRIRLFTGYFFVSVPVQRGFLLSSWATRALMIFLIRAMGSGLSNGK